MEAQKERNVREQFVGKTDEVFLTQYAFDFKVEELKTATNLTTENKITLHVYSNDSKNIAKVGKEIYDAIVKEFRN